MRLLRRRPQWQIDGCQYFWDFLPSTEVHSRLIPSLRGTDLTAYRPVNPSATGAAAKPKLAIARIDAMSDDVVRFSGRHWRGEG
jgi:hypothetical protein